MTSVEEHAPRYTVIRCARWIDKQNKLGRRCTRPHGHAGRCRSRLRRI